MNEDAKKSPPRSRASVGIRPSDQRRGGPVAIDQLGAKLMRPVLGRRGLGEGDICFHWAAIVGGSFLASNSAPERIQFPKGERTGGILHLRVPSGALATQLQHLIPQIVQRVNGFYGYPAIADVRIHQRPLPPRPPRLGEPPPLPEPDRERLALQLNDVEHPRLKDALAKLGETMARRTLAAGKGSRGGKGGGGR